MKGIVLGLALLASGCAIEHVGPPGVRLTQTISIKPSQVAVYTSSEMIRGPYSHVDDLDVEDDQVTPPRVLQKRLREQAGSRGANAIILDPFNRRPNGTRVFTGLSLDDPFKHYRATAVWVGEQSRPVRALGTIGRNTLR